MQGSGRVSISTYFPALGTPAGCPLIHSGSDTPQSQFQPPQVQGLSPTALTSLQKPGTRVGQPAYNSCFCPVWLHNWGSHNSSNFRFNDLPKWLPELRKALHSHGSVPSKGHKSGPSKWRRCLGLEGRASLGAPPSQHSTCSPRQALQTLLDCSVHFGILPISTRH